MKKILPYIVAMITILAIVGPALACHKNKQQNWCDKEGAVWFRLSCPAPKSLLYKNEQNVNVVVTQTSVSGGRDRGEHGGGWGHGNGGWNRGNDWNRGITPDPFLTGIVSGAVGGWVSNWFRPEPRVVVVEQPAPQVVVVEKPQGPAVWSAEWYDYCNGKYKSFDAKTGYFTGYDGNQHFCS